MADKEKKPDVDMEKDGGNGIEPSTSNGNVNGNVNGNGNDTTIPQTDDNTVDFQGGAMNESKHDNGNITPILPAPNVTNHDDSQSTATIDDEKKVIDDMNTGNNEPSQKVSNNNLKSAPFEYFDELIKKNGEEKCEAQETVSCKKLSIIIEVLALYQQQNGEKEEQKMFEDLKMAKEIQKRYPYLWSDFAHINNKHLSKGNTKRNGEQFSELNAEVKSKVKCELKNCEKWNRNNRNRQEDETQEDIKACNFRDFLDSIHVKWLHSYDTGFRLKKYDVESDYDNDEKEVVDTKFEKIKNFVKNVQKTVKKTHRTHGDKSNYLNEDCEIEPFIPDMQGDTIAQATVDTAQSAVASDADQVSYNYGYRCYYWKWYENNDDIDKYYHPNQTYGQWYVKPKWKDMKQEAKEALPSPMSPTNWDRAVDKAQEYKKINEIKNMKSDNTILPNQATVCDTKLEYSVDDRSTITTDHLIALVCYTDYTDFSYWFSKSFRKRDKTETNEELKKRHSNYHYLAKNIRELVELFGTTMENSEIEHYYTGISLRVKFPAFVARLCCPTSTTTELSIATIFAKEEGVILTLTKNDKNGLGLRYFNVSYISAYKSEEERLFVGGRQFINVYNIISMSNCHNYINYVRPIQKFEAVLSDSFGSGSKIKKIDYRVIKHLINHYLNIEKNEFPEYMNEIFASIMESKKSIRINIDLEEQQALLLKSIFYGKYDDGNAKDDDSNDNDDNDDNGSNAEDARNAKNAKDQEDEDGDDDKEDDDPNEYFALVRIDKLTKLMKNLESITLVNCSNIMPFPVYDNFFEFFLNKCEELKLSKLEHFKIINRKKLYKTPTMTQFKGDLQSKYGWKYSMRKRKLGFKKAKVGVLFIDK